MTDSSFLKLTDEEMAAITKGIIESSPIVKMMRRIDREQKWGPEARSFLVRCAPWCNRHHCQSCGTPVAAMGDPRLCTDTATGNFCYDCSGNEFAPDVTVHPATPYATAVEYGRPRIVRYDV